MIRVHGLSDVGQVRDENQDSILIEEPGDEWMRRHRGTLVVVADGMGGLEDGKVASEIAIDALRETYFAAEGEACAALEEAVLRANSRIHRHAREFAGGQAMGSTCTALAMLEHYVCIAQVGDSRAYHYHRGQIRQVTRDHSLVRELVDRGELDPRSAQYAFHRNVLTRGLGLREDVEVDVFELSEVSDGDLFLLSSDGLHELIAEDELVAGIERFGDRLDALCDHLVELANSRGGADNISVVVALLGEFASRAASLPAHAPVAAPAAGSPAPRQRFGCLVPLAILTSFCIGVIATLVLVSFSTTVARQETFEKLQDLLRSVRRGETAATEAVRALETLVEKEGER